MAGDGAGADTALAMGVGVADRAVALAVVGVAEAEAAEEVLAAVAPEGNSTIIYGKVNTYNIGWFAS